MFDRIIYDRSRGSRGLYLIDVIEIEGYPLTELYIDGEFQYTFYQNNKPLFINNVDTYLLAVADVLMRKYKGSEFNDETLATYKEEFDEMYYEYEGIEKQLVVQLAYMYIQNDMNNIPAILQHYKERI